MPSNRSLDVRHEAIRLSRLLARVGYGCLWLASVTACRKVEPPSQTAKATPLPVASVAPIAPPPVVATAPSSNPEPPDPTALLPDPEAAPEEPRYLPNPSPWAFQIQQTLKAGKEVCASAVRHAEPFEECTVTLVGSGNAVVITVVTECGGDSCSSKSWLMREEAKDPIPLGELAGGFAFAPSLDFYVVDHRAFANETDLRMNYYRRAPKLNRVALGTGRSTHFADCFSPTLSPGGQWFLCRNRRGDVLRVPVQGGKLQRVAKNQTKGQPEFSPYSFIYPNEPYFYTTNEVRFRSGVADDDVEQTAPWSE